MLLKDKLAKIFKSKNLKLVDKIKPSIADGFVDIKGYDKDGKLFYHDCGDNVVTDWMRHAIIQMLAGVTYVSNGNMPSDFTNSGRVTNPDGYVFSGYQYTSSDGATAVENAITKRNSSNVNNCNYAVFPTKILLGTGKEYANWDTLFTENADSNSEWYNNMVSTFGTGDEASAKKNFDTYIDGTNNTLSGSIANGVYSGDGTLQQTRTVNDPDSSTSEVASAISMYRNYNVVGAIKTPLVGSASESDMLNTTVSESGRLLKPIYRGIGYPAFVYFNQLEAGSDGKIASDVWEDSGEITLSKDSDDKFLTKLTFSFTLPQQDSSTSADGKYYPYNGWQIKQIGLYNDARLIVNSGSTETRDGSYYARVNMPDGMLLAVKNIAPFTKTAETTYRITWTLTI